MSTQQAPTIINVPAGSDLSAKQYYFMDVVAGQLSVAGSGTRVAGVLDNNPDSAGKPGALQTAGVAKVLAGGSITSGAGVASNASGKAVAATGSAFVCGISISDETKADGEYVEVLLTGASAVGLAAMSETVTTGALNVAVPKTILSVTGTQPYSLGAPTYEGQTKYIVCELAASAPAGTLTVSSPDDTTGFVCPATFFFDHVGQILELTATAALKWRCTKKIRNGVKALVIGTTVTTGICDMSHVDVSVTGTVASTSTKALPNGAAVGEIVSITCSTAATTPHGDLGGTFVKKDETAGTLLDDFTLTTDNALLEWTGAAWKPLILSGTTLSIA